MSRSWLVPLAALLLLQVAAEESRRCTHAAAGDLVGYQIYVNSSTLQPTGRREYSAAVPSFTGCALNGVVARACDLFPPRVDVEDGLRAVRVARLGPRLRALTLQVWLYCDPLVAPPTVNHVPQHLGTR